METIRIISLTCNTCQVAKVKYPEDDYMGFKPICDDCTEELLGAYERDQEARYYREGRYAR